MTDEARAAHQLTAITDGLLGLFADYCQRTANALGIALPADVNIDADGESNE